MNPLSYTLLVFRLHSADITPPQQPYPDAWFAEDKLKHMLTSTAATGFAFAGLRTISDDKSTIVAAAATAAALGIWKEVHDRNIGRIFSKRDLVWDAIGIALGVTIVSRAR